MLWRFKTVPHAVVTPTQIVSSLLHICNFAIVLDCNVNTCVDCPKGFATYRLRTTALHKDRQTDTDTWTAGWTNGQRLT